MEVNVRYLSFLMHCYFDRFHENVLILELLQGAESPLFDVFDAPPTVIPLLREVVEGVHLPIVQNRKRLFDGFTENSLALH